MEKFILDVTCGGRTIWFQKCQPNTIYADIRKAEKGICPERPNFEVNPDILADFRELPFPDNSFKLVVFDPPHLKNLVKTGIMFKKYGTLLNSWQDDIKRGFTECFRILEEYGVLIFKWNERDISLSKVLKLSPIKPLFGHTTGSKSKTHWCCFMKIPRCES